MVDLWSIDLKNEKSEIFVQGEDENIKKECVPSFFRSSIETVVSIETALWKNYFVCGLDFFLTFKVIEVTTEKKSAVSFLEQLILHAY